MSAAFSLPNQPIIAWYGDDFTGSAAVMEVLAFNGISSVLFLSVPDAAMQARFGTRQAIGIAGDARSRSPEWMKSNLPPIFEALRKTGAQIIHYKVCSTMDSSPTLGSIGYAADIAGAAFAAMVIPAPRIGRWQAFGNLFAKSPSGITRLDRHPTMANHPATPMHEADVRLHLAAQTAQKIGLVDVTALHAKQGLKAFENERNKGARIVAFDVIDDRSLAEVGATLWHLAKREPLFAIGSQGVEDALVAHWADLGHRASSAPKATATDQIAIISGSCSPDTARQISTATESGFVPIRVDASKAVAAELWRVEAAKLEAEALSVLPNGQSPILFTAMGPNDPAIAEVKLARANAGLDAITANALLAAGLGNVLARLKDHAKLTRVAIAGGDTSSHATAQLGVVALTAEAAIAPSVAVLHGHYANPEQAPLELVLKGGQMGNEKLFVAMRDGP